MEERIGQTIYFEKWGPQNTRRTLEIAGNRARDLDTHAWIVTTTYGDTGALAVEMFPDLCTIVVTHPVGFKGPNTHRLKPEHIAAIEQGKGKILTATHIFGGIGRAIRNKFRSYQIEEIIAFTYRTVCEGFKVCVEVAMMAADAGLVRVGDPIVTVGGTLRGADTAVVLTPVNSEHFFDIKIQEILCKPYPGGANQPVFTELKI